MTDWILAYLLCVCPFDSCRLSLSSSSSSSLTDIEWCLPWIQFSFFLRLLLRRLNCILNLFFLWSVLLTDSTSERRTSFYFTSSSRLFAHFAFKRKECKFFFFFIFFSCMKCNSRFPFPFSIQAESATTQEGEEDQTKKKIRVSFDIRTMHVVQTPMIECFRQVLTESWKFMRAKYPMILALFFPR